jgi:3'-5' exoribonuclease-like protein
MTRIIVYDTEFIENGSTIDLISIGMVDDFGHEFYGISTEFDATKASDWVRENVLAKLPPRYSPLWMPRTELRRQVLDFLVPRGVQFEPGPVCELWADYGAYDHVALAQLFGTMMDLPPGIPMFTHELMQLWESSGAPAKPGQLSKEHDALDDARHGMAIWRLCTGR